MSILGFFGIGNGRNDAPSPPSPDEENAALSTVPIVPEPASSSTVPEKGGEFVPASGITTGLRSAATAAPFRESVVSGNSAADGARVRYQDVDARQSTVGTAASIEPMRAGRGSLQWSEAITSPIGAETRLGGLGTASGKFDAGMLPVMGGSDPAMTPAPDPGVAAIAAAWAAKRSALSFLEGA